MISLINTPHEGGRDIEVEDRHSRAERGPLYCDDLSNVNPLQNLLDRPIAFHRCFVRIGIGCRHERIDQDKLKDGSLDKEVIRWKIRKGLKNSKNTKQNF